MARIKIDFPKKQARKFEIPVRITDINYGNHLGNDSFITILHEARMQWLGSAGFSELNAGGVSLIMGDLAIDFKKEVLYGDTLFINVVADELTNVSFDIYYELLNQQGMQVAIAKTGMVCFNYDVKKVSLITRELRNFLEN